MQRGPRTIRTANRSKQCGTDTACFSFWTEPLSPLPQLLPRLYKLLNLPCAREMVAGDAATKITTLIEILHRAAGEMREPMTQVFQVLPAQNFFRDLRTPGHDEGILACSLCVRLCLKHPSLLSSRPERSAVEGPALFQRPEEPCSSPPASPNPGPDHPFHNRR